MTLQGLVWNCRGLRKTGVATFLKSLIFQYKLHFVGLQETMVECGDNLLRRFDANQDYLWLWNPSKGKSGGILVGVRREFYDVGSFRQGNYMLQLNLWDKTNRLKWNLLIVYGAAQEENKLSFLAELSSFCSTNVDPLLIGGDFNIIRYANTTTTTTTTTT
jgi:exonuclease III